MSKDNEFDPETTNLVLGPINKPRWIYSCAKQMMDRIKKLKILRFKVSFFVIFNIKGMEFKG